MKQIFKQVISGKRTSIRNLDSDMTHWAGEHLSTLIGAVLPPNHVADDFVGNYGVEWRLK